MEDMAPRHVRCLLAVFVLVVLAGCLGFGGSTTEAGLAQNQTYDWDTDRDVTIDLNESEYRAVYDIENQSQIRIYQSTRYGTEHPIGIRSIQFRHPNDTVVNDSAMGVSESRSSVTVSFPAEEGQFAFTASKRSKQFNLPTFIEGSYEISVPEGFRVDNIVLSTVRPRGYETELVGDRVKIRWDSVTSRSVTVNYYLPRDLYLFSGLIVVVALGGALGASYVWLQIKQLRKRRMELGLDVESEGGFDDEREGPPPGMR